MAVRGTLGGRTDGETTGVPIAGIPGGAGGEEFCRRFTLVAVIAPTPLEIRFDNPISS